MYKIAWYIHRGLGITKKSHPINCTPSVSRGMQGFWKRDFESSGGLQGKKEETGSFRHQKQRGGRNEAG
jgi:hypothetical protein